MTERRRISSSSPYEDVIGFSRAVRVGDTVYVSGTVAWSDPPEAGRLVGEGGAAWEGWDAAVTDNLNRVQNEDGGWVGHHCITGRTFVTSAALLTLMADRTPVPLELVDDEE